MSLFVFNSITFCKKEAANGGHWTYHNTYKAGCCGGPGCIILLLTVPLWPIIGGVITVKDNITSSPNQIEAKADIQTQKIDDMLEG